MVKDYVELSNGRVGFGKWKNGEATDALIKACKNKKLIGITDEQIKQTIIDRIASEWIISYSIFHGGGFLKGATVDQTFDKIQELDIDEATKLGKAFNEFNNSISEEVKKKQD